MTSPPVTSGLAGLDGLPGVGLEQMSADAALMTRTDRKYVVPLESLPGLVGRVVALDPGTRVLDIHGRRRHAYSSTYLDTPDLDGWWSSARRRRRRFKVRSRHYRDTDLAFTEVKTRGPRGTTVKTRTPLPGHGRARDLDVLPDVHLAFVDTELARAGVDDVDVSGLVPTLHTSYLRSTLWLPSSGSRVTIDTDLAWSLPWSEETVRVPGLAVVETKTARGGVGIDRALWAEGHRPVRISKYGTGLGLLVPELPDHRWHRTLTRIRAAALTTTEPRLSA